MHTTKSQLKLFFLLCCSLSLAGCASSANYLRTIHSWKGAPINRLVKVWGYPDRNSRAPDGNRLYIYKQETKGRMPLTIQGGDTYLDNSGAIITTPTFVSGGQYYDNKCKTWFEVNRHKRIVNVSARGNSCVATKRFMQRMSHH